MFPGADRYDASPPNTLDWMEGLFWSQKDGHQSLGLDCHDYGGFRHEVFKLIADFKPKKSKIVFDSKLYDSFSKM